MKEHPILFNGQMVRAILEGRKTQTRRVVRNPGRLNGLMLEGEEAQWCPYGGPGDLLWVRETWMPMTKGCAFKADSIINETFGLKWKPSIHMPRWASRLTLRITDVRVQRVQEITEGDARAEGMPGAGHSFYGEFRLTWDSINAKRGYSWKSNPYVWVLTFEIVRKA